MAKIKTDVAGRTLPQKLQTGKLVITKSTDNPNAPGNEALLAALSAAQDELKAAVLAAEAARTTSIQRTSEQADAEKRWRACLNALANFTEAVTGGDSAKILSTGFDVRAEASAKVSEPPALVEGIVVRLNGQPGRAKLKWPAATGALGYFIQGTADPEREGNWSSPQVSTKTTANTNGASPGQPYWYRVAAFNSAGQGPWSMPAPRPVI